MKILHGTTINIQRYISGSNPVPGRVYADSELKAAKTVLGRINGTIEKKKK